MKKLGFFLAVSLLMSLVGLQFSHANQYKCAKMIYSNGWLKKYEHLGNTWGANTKKHGALSSTTGSSVEKTTSSVDPGVITGNLMSSVQYTSSWGDCSMLEYHLVKELRDDYIEQNIHEIKKQIAMGQGYHVDSLAFLSGCSAKATTSWSSKLQNQTEKLYEVESGSEFSKHIDAMIGSDAELRSQCQQLKG